MTDPEIVAAWAEIHDGHAARLVRRPAGLQRHVPSVGAIRLRSVREAQGRAALARVDGGRHERAARARRNGALPAGDRRRTSPQMREQGPSHARSHLGFHAGRCAMWTVASRDCSDAVSRMDKVEGPRDGLAFAGRALLGVLAFELALEAARWVLANLTDGSDLPVNAQQLDEEWNRVRSLRSDVVAHLGTWIQDDVDSSLRVDSSGISVRQELVFSFAEWRRWLDILEPWAMAHGKSDHRSASATLTRPPKLPLKSLRRPKKRNGAVKGALPTRDR